MLKSALRVLFLLAAVLFSPSLSAREYIPPRPLNYDQVQMYLVTVGLGRDVHTRYGHTLIRIVDSSRDLDYVVNWGLFDFDDPLFVWNFFIGRNRYRMGFMNFDHTLRFYRRVEKRAVWEQEINLTSQQKKQLFEKIVWNAREENLYYDYDYFLSNCATIPRDYLDEVLHHKIKPILEAKKAQITFRDYIYQYLSLNPIIGFGLEVLVSSNVDFKLNWWQEMFYPVKLAEHLSDMPSVSDKGEVHPETKLLGPKQLLVDLSLNDEPVTNPYLFFILPFWVLIIGGILSSLRGWGGRFIAGTLMILWALLFGVLGLGIAVSNFTYHLIGLRNINILLYWPTDILLFLPGLWLLFWPKRFKRVAKFFRTYAAAHVATITIHFLIFLSHTIVQDMHRVVMYLSPLTLVFWIFMLRFDRLYICSEVTNN